MISIIRGQDKNLIIRLTDQETGDPYDYSGVELIQACFKDTNGDSFWKQYLPINGDVLNTSDLISNIPSTMDIKEGQPISGLGIPLGATILKTPASLVSPTAAGVIQISAFATATNVGASILIGDILILTPIQWGKIKVILNESDTDSLGDSDFEIKVRTAGITLYKLFLSELDIQDRIC